MGKGREEAKREVGVGNGMDVKVGRIKTIESSTDVDRKDRVHIEIDFREGIQILMNLLC